MLRRGVIGAAAVLAAGSVQVAQAQIAPAPTSYAVPQPHALLMLIRTTIVALNQANQTGNYTVLRDLSAPAFHSQHTATGLADIFRSLRSSNVDLSPVVYLTPELLAGPAVTAQGQLEVAGRFPTTPKAIQFQLAFSAVGGVWKMSGLGVNLVEAPPPAAPQAKNEPPKPARKPADEKR